MLIQFDKLNNARDLGGTALSGGRHVKPGLLLRTGKLYGISDADACRLSEEYRIRHIFDFRDDSEAIPQPDRPIAGAQLHRLLVLPTDERDWNMDFFSMTPDTVTGHMRRVYRNMAECPESLRAYSEFFRILLSAEGQAVLWHCTQGKDRTGIAAILLLTALGADEKTVTDEYYLSNIYFKSRLNSLEQDGMSGHQLAVMERLMLVTPECLNEFLNSVHRRFGDLETYLREYIGVSRQEMLKLREYYTC